MSDEHLKAFYKYGFDIETMNVSRKKETYHANAKAMLEVSKDFPEKDVQDASLRRWMLRQGNDWYRLAPKWKRDILDSVGAELWMTNINICRWLDKLELYSSAIHEICPDAEACRWVNAAIDLLRRGKRVPDWKRMALKECGITAETPKIYARQFYDHQWFDTLQEYKRLYPIGRKPSKFDPDGVRWINWQNTQRKMIKNGHYNQVQINLLAEAGITLKARKDAPNQWNPSQPYQMRWYNNLQKYKAIYASNRKPSHSDPDGDYWLRWCSNQRNALRSGRCSDIKVQLLAEAGIAI